MNAAPTPALLRTAEMARALADLGAAHVARVCRTSDRFFEAEAGAIATACEALAARFDGGGTMYVFGPPQAESDADHVAVEFVHPVIVGKRALPARAVDADELGALVDARDIVMGIDPSGVDPVVDAALETCRGRGALTILLSSRSEAAASTKGPGIVFAVPAQDPLIVQEVHETLYHVLWELVHVFLEAGGSV